MLMLIALILSASNAIANPILEHNSPRIIGGAEATENQFPYQVSLRHISNLDHFCGGSVIVENWILTAANCVSNLEETSKIVAVVGSYRLQDIRNLVNIDLIKIHPNYDAQYYLHDIALLKTDRSMITAFGTVQIISIPTQGTELPLNSMLTFTGWGLTSFPSSSPSNVLRYITLRTISMLDCGTLLAGFLPVTKTHLCTYMPPGNGICQKDNGGPLVDFSNLVQYGISSWGIPCGRGYPDVFTYVSYYSDWISNNIQNL